MFMLKIILVWLVLHGQENCDAEETSEAPVKENTLEYITAIFRHGERTVDAGSIYPKDPYMNLTFYPYGPGELTSEGKEREYKFGRALRKRYDKFLGDVYTPGILEPLSTDISRTKASLALVLAGLYPPIGNIMEWHPRLNWQPIPFRYLSYTEDLFFTVPAYFCPNFATEYDLYLEVGEGKALQDKYQDLFEYLRDNTGRNVTRMLEVFHVHSCLKSELEWNLTLPEWTNKVWPEPLTQATIDSLASQVATPKLKQLSGGLLIKRITDTMKDKSTNQIEPENKKMTLYSGHDISVVHALGALNLYTPHLVPYGACILIELHKISGSYYVKILYEDYTEDKPRKLTVPGCDTLCPLEKFESLVNIPKSDDPCGVDTKVFEPHLFERHYYSGKLRYKTVVKMYTEFVQHAPPKQVLHYSPITLDITNLTATTFL